MKKRLSIALAAILAVTAIVGVTTASAATEFGSSCKGEETVPDTVISIAHGPGSPLPVAAPTSGIITTWTVNANFESEGEEAFLTHFLRQTLAVFRPAGPKTYTQIGESVGGTFNPKGLATYPARIPVLAGDLLSLGGSGLAIVCEGTDPADKVAFTEKSVTFGVPAPFEGEAEEAQVPVSAKIEPDADHDGYGDETQDLCPQSAAYQTPCPVVTLSQLPIVGKKAVTVRVATSLGAPVGVSGTVQLAKGKTATITAAPQAVAPGTLAAFSLPLPKSVTTALASMPAKKTLTLSVLASATNVTGAPSTTTSTVKLHGLAKPVSHHKKHSK